MYSTVYLFWYCDVTVYLICIILKLLLFYIVGTLIARGNGIDVSTIKVTHIFHRFVRKFIIMNMLVIDCGGDVRPD